MPRTAFDRQLGLSQGRLLEPESTGYVPPEGHALFVLGSDVAGQKASFAAGDFADVYQFGRFDDAKALKLKTRTRGTVANLEGNLQWLFQVRIDDAVMLEQAIDPRRSRTNDDYVIPLAAFSPYAHKLSFRLMLRGTTIAAAETELPAVYVDAVVLDPAFAPRPQLGNRMPEPNEVRVPLTSTIALDVIDVGPTGVDAARTNVFVNDVPAVVAGALVAPFNGARAAVSTPANSLRIVLDPLTAFESLSTNTVRVETAIVGGLTTQFVYTFTGIDAAPPYIQSAQATDVRAVRVVFSEAMTRDSVRVDGITITRTLGEISVPVAPVAVAFRSDRELEITLDQPATPNATYTLTITSATDENDNPIMAPGDTVTFLGFSASRPVGRDWVYFEMMPDLNQEEDETGDLARLLAILQELGDLMLYSIDRFTDLIDPDVAPIEFVDAMLADLGNPFVFETAHLSEVDRRRLAQELVSLYKQRGTAPGIIGAIAFFLGVEVTLQYLAVAPLGIGEWELGTTWVLGTSDLVEIMTFRIVTPRQLTASERARMTAIVTWMKYEREHFKIVEPPTVLPPEDLADHLELSVSELGVNWLLH